MIHLKKSDNDIKLECDDDTYNIPNRNMSILFTNSTEKKLITIENNMGYFYDEINDNNNNKYENVVIILSGNNNLKITSNKIHSPLNFKLIKNISKNIIYLLIYNRKIKQVLHENIYDIRCLEFSINIKEKLIEVQRTTIQNTLTNKVTEQIKETKLDKSIKFSEESPSKQKPEQKPEQKQILEQKEELKPVIEIKPIMNKSGIFTTIFLGGYGNILLDIIYTYLKHDELKIGKLKFYNNTDINDPGCCGFGIKDHHGFGGHVAENNHLGCNDIFDILDIEHEDTSYIDLVRNNKITTIDNVNKTRVNNQNIVTHDVLSKFKLDNNIYKIYDYIRIKDNIMNYITTTYKSVVTKSNLFIHLRFNISTDNYELDTPNEESFKKCVELYNKLGLDYICILTSNREKCIKFIDNLVDSKTKRKILYIDNEPMYIEHTIMSMSKYLCLGLSTFSISASIINNNPFKHIFYTDQIYNYYRQYNHCFGIKDIPQSYNVNNMKDEILNKTVWYDDNCYEIVFYKWEDSEEINKSRSRKKLTLKKKRYTILILTCEVRKHLLYRLCNNLVKQIKNNKYTDVSIMINKDKTKNIGMKRNTLINYTNSDYCAFIDDDDMVSDDYVKTIMTSLSDDIDILGFNLLYNNNGKLQHITMHTYDNDVFKNKQKLNKNIKINAPNHLNPKKTSIHKNNLFKEINWQEDSNFQSEIKKLNLKEKYIDKDMYIYLFDNNISLSTKLK